MKVKKSSPDGGDRQRQARQQSLSLDSGVQSGSRWGLKGTEDLGNGYKVGFVLESGFGADTGKSAQGSRLFGRESLLYVTGPYGEIGLGRTGGTGASGIAGRYAKAGMLSAFGTAFGKYTALTNSAIAIQASRVDNAITYQTPKFSGFQAAVQYSFKMDDSAAGDEGKASANRSYGAHLTYQNGPFAGLLSASSVNYDSSAGDVDDSFEVSLGGSYDFGVIKAFVGGQYFKDMAKSAFNSLPSAAPKKLDGYGLILSASAPVAGGSLIFGVDWLDAEDAARGSSTDVERMGGSVAYTYPLSKRTNLYALAGLGQDKIKADETTKVKYYRAAFGIRHRF